MSCEYFSDVKNNLTYLIYDFVNVIFIFFPRCVSRPLSARQVGKFSINTNNSPRRRSHVRHRLKVCLLTIALFMNVRTHVYNTQSGSLRKRISSILQIYTAKRERGAILNIFLESKSVYNKPHLPSPSFPCFLHPRGGFARNEKKSIVCVDNCSSFILPDVRVKSSD